MARNKKWSELGQNITQLIMMRVQNFTIHVYMMLIEKVSLKLEIMGFN